MSFSVHLSEIGLSLASMFGISIGQILFRLSAQRIDEERWVTSTLGNPWLWAALIVYGVATLLWVHVLRTAPLSRVYPLIALAFVVVPLLDTLLLGESLRPQALIGGAIIVAGVVIAVQGIAE
jgi:drug/metabolite transporter (DMT)-like permease